MVFLIGFGLNCSRDIMARNIEEEKKKNAEPTKEYQNPVFLNVDILLIAAQKSIIHSIF